MPPPGFWAEVRAACDAHGALLVFDEVPNGLGKTGRFFAFEHFGVVPDIVVLGKALGGGILPLAAAIARRDLDLAGHLSVGHYTHEKNPLLARAGLDDPGHPRRARDWSIAPLASASGHSTGSVRSVVGTGASETSGVSGFAWRWSSSRTGATKTPAREAARAVARRAFDRGLSFTVSGESVLVLSPPLVITEPELEEAFAILDACLGEVEAGASALRTRRSPTSAALALGGVSRRSVGCRNHPSITIDRSRPSPRC